MEDKRDASVELKEQKKEKSEKKQRKAFKGFMKIIIWFIVIVVLIVSTLFLSSRIAEFDSIADMLRFIFSHF